MVDEQIRSLNAKLLDGNIEAAEEIPTTLHSVIVDSEPAAYIMVYFASHGTNELYINLVSMSRKHFTVG